MSAGDTTAPTDGGRPEPEGAELGYLATLSNWGRWGPGDELGTLNFISAPARLEAVASVRLGRVVSCGRPIPDDRTIEDEKPFLRHVLSSGAEAPPAGPAYAEEWIGLYVHGHSTTHLDAPSHAFWDGQMYGGRPAAAVKPGSGAGASAVAAAGGSIVGRGVLFDIARVRGVSWLGPGDPITVVDFASCEERLGVAVGEGDILFVRTGRGARQAEVGRTDPRNEGNPGLGVDVLPWLSERRVALLGTDVVAEVRPRPPSALTSPVHTVALVAMGLWLVDNLELERLAEACAQAERWSYLVVVAPLNITGGTGSPVNPIAVL